MGWIYSDDKWAAFTLKKQLTITFAIVVIASLSFTEILAIATLGGTIGLNAHAASRLLSDQLSSNLATSIAANAAALFEAALNRTLDTATTVVQQSTQDTILRTDYSRFTAQSYFDGGPLPQPVQSVNVNDPKSRFYGTSVQYISIAHPTYVTNQDPQNSNVPVQLTQLAQTYLQNTAWADAFLRYSYEFNSDIVSLYLGFDEMGLYKTFPATGTTPNSGLIRAQGPYDVTTRGWYKSTKLNQNASHVIYGPYQNSQGRGWVLTTGKPIFDKNNNFIGAAAVSITVQALSDQLAALAQNSSTTGVTIGIYKLADGSALAHPQWTSNSASGQFKYSNQTNPVITSNAWSRILASRADYSTSSSQSNFGSIQNYEDGTGNAYLLLWKTLTLDDGTAASSTGYNATFVAIAAVPWDAVSTTVNNVTSKMYRTLGIAIAISLGIFLIIAVAVFVLINVVAESAMRPMSKLADDAKTISNKIGTRDLFNGVDSSCGSFLGEGSTSSEGLRRRNNGAVVDETERLTQRFYEMVKSVRESSQVNHEVAPVNPFHMNSNLPDYERAGYAENVVEMLPDLPPRYEDSDFIPTQ